MISISVRAFIHGTRYPALSITGSKCMLKIDDAIAAVKTKAQPTPQGGPGGY